MNRSIYYISSQFVITYSHTHWFWAFQQGLTDGAAASVSTRLHSVHGNRKLFPREHIEPGNLHISYPYAHIERNTDVPAKAGKFWFKLKRSRENVNSGLTGKPCFSSSFKTLVLRESSRAKTCAAREDLEFPGFPLRILR